MIFNNKKMKIIITFERSCIYAGLFALTISFLLDLRDIGIALLHTYCISVTLQDLLGLDFLLFLLVIYE